MFKKWFALFILIVFSVSVCGCTPATKNKYKEYYVEKWIDDPNAVSSEITSSDDTYSDADNSTSGAASGNTSPVPAKEVKSLNVKDFGAVGDGKTDDGPAISKAINALYNYGAGSKLIFESNKTYFVSKPDNSSEFALQIRSLDGITFEGNNTTILCDKGVRYMSITSCTNVSVKGLNFDLKTRAHFVGEVTSVNVDEGYFDVRSDRDIGFNDEWNPTNSPFCLKAADGTSRSFIVIKKITTVDVANRIYRVYAVMDDPSLGTAMQVKSLSLNQQIIVPVPFIGHCGDPSFLISSNTDITLSNINVWNVAHFVFFVNWNKGTVNFDKVSVAPPSDEKVVFSSWRDVYHCKSNSAKLIWKDCVSKGNGDDIINISANMMYVKTVVSPTEVVCHWPETNGSYGTPEEGSSIIIWNADTGKLIGRTTLKKVINANENRYRLTNPISGLKSGENIRFCFESHAAPNSQVINCDFDGTLRFHGGPLTVSDSRIRLIKMWIDYEGYLEGPIPHDITFRNCAFNIAGGADTMIISSNNPKSKWAEGDYRLENIVFENCTGLKKEHFQNQLNFNPKSPDYITITPALS